MLKLKGSAGDSHAKKSDPKWLQHATCLLGRLIDKGGLQSWPRP